MRLALVLAALVLAGCAAPAAVTGPREGPVGGAELSEPVRRPAEAPSTHREAADPHAPPVTLDGAPAHAMALHAREGTRTLCGGAIAAVPADEAAPGQDFSDFAYEGTDVLRTEDGRAWATDRYVAPEGRRLYVSNVGGAGFTPDDGVSACPAQEHEGPAYNVLLHAREGGSLAVRLLPDARPPAPGA